MKCPVWAAVVAGWLVAMTPAAARFPWGVAVDLMAAEDRALVRAVLEAPTLQRKYGPRRFRGQAKYFEYFLDHIDACSVLSEVTGLIDYRARSLPDGRLYAENIEEATGFLKLVHCETERRVYFVQGTQRGPWTARGRGVAVVEFRAVGEQDIEYSGRLFVRIDNPVAAALSKAFFVFVKTALDRNFAHVMRQPIGATMLVSQEPVRLRQYLEQLPAADREALQGLLALMAAE
jgi:hypothetical protein